MKRSAALVMLVLVAIAGAVLGGCAPPKSPGQKTGSSPATVAKPQVGTPDVGTQTLQSFIPLSATSFSDGIAVFGYDVSGGTSSKDEALAIMRPSGGTGWDKLRIGNTPRYPNGSAEIGSTRIVVGASYDPSQDPSKPLIPFEAYATSATGGVFQTHDLAQSEFYGKSARFYGVALTGDPQASGTQFMIVGAQSTSQNGEIGVPTATAPFAFTSTDGTTWQTTADLPLPTGVTGAEASAVTYAPPGTAYPGVVVAGVGWIDDPQIGSRIVVILWRTTDAGKTWKIVSDKSFNQAGRNLDASSIAADSHSRAIVVAGWGDVEGGSTGQIGAIDWTIAGDGTVNRAIDTLPPNRSSATEALIARPEGGFLTATEVFDSGQEMARPDVPLHGNPLSKVWSSADGANWVDQTSSIKDMNGAAVISGIAEFAGRAAFFGIDNKSSGMAYVVDSATLK